MLLAMQAKNAKIALRISHHLPHLGLREILV